MDFTAPAGSSAIGLSAVGPVQTVTIGLSPGMLVLAKDMPSITMLGNALRNVTNSQALAKPGELVGRRTDQTLPVCPMRTINH
ncbi:uncharacterized protein CANTADRAFT_88674 [Suhomyces tanzawaensis NRRL Y-17324]|uniref:Uncharacterized protein n=1 Tax=Suhomyces tanzawaensis NRRL Y-17324 TaxID=984487 RepID=A0A1E4SMK9_9ASCO|nr:uncharacterized protein CANTADRAFT_88674 [Suhomyces tanzawaensis NRRL Y-17324]ODV80764.1 hypothetical protein CANTADRAFT_88674 [Suhomyces tanzawaensis NRRL Y-17324]